MSIQLDKFDGAEELEVADCLESIANSLSGDDAITLLDAAVDIRYLVSCVICLERGHV